ncbi:hypothetical protein RRG08_036752 [Elysia crispata]|uniref:Uncharacterized protein n=1 Tax=Elysia crispata TaxID=231223 RepID=A0AAE0ZGS3_9GAST|nr:hypothetical protein RRG08_036752 [Elysia crispata]
MLFTTRRLMHNVLTHPLPRRHLETMGMNWSTHSSSTGSELLPEVVVDKTPVLMRPQPGQNSLNLSKHGTEVEGRLYSRASSETHSSHETFENKLSNYRHAGSILLSTGTSAKVKRTLDKISLRAVNRLKIQNRLNTLWLPECCCWSSKHDDAVDSVIAFCLYGRRIDGQSPLISTAPPVATPPLPPPPFQSIINITVPCQPT